MNPISKKQIKQQKILRKRQSSKQQSQKYGNDGYSLGNYQKYYIQNPNRGHHEAQNQLQLENQILKGKKWWLYINSIYFKEIYQRDIISSQNSFSGQKLINYFNNETQLKGIFKDVQIIQKYPQLDENNLIHAVFKFNSLQYQLVSFSFINYTQSLNGRSNKSSDQEIETPEFQTLQWKISIPDKTLSILQEVQQTQFKEILKFSNLQYNQNICDLNTLSKMLKFLQLKAQSLQQLDFQLKLWKSQENKINSLNSISWNKLLHNFQTNKNTFETNLKVFDKEIFSIRQSLMHHTILRYFQIGVKDKTNAMLKALQDSLKQLKPQKTRELNLKKFFQTDCKICFCSFNSDSNQVLYCDSCNTSFHLACYGLHEIPPENQYFCDCCSQKKNEQNLKKVSLRKICCQICCKANFPIKCIDGHFYHMTCLVIFNFFTIKQGKIQLKDNQTHKSILKQIIKCELQCQNCIFCSGSQGSESGMRFKCSFNDCKSSMHPICAYIHGCLFNVKKNMKQKKLDVEIYCNKHDCERDYIQQSYLRRYMCNFKNTSSKCFQDFRNEYTKQIQRRQIYQYQRPIENESQILPGLLFDSKNLRRFLSNRQQKPQITSTETRKILEKLIKSS